MENIKEQDSDFIPKKIYIAGALDFCSPDMLDIYKEIDSNLTKLGHKTYLPHIDCEKVVNGNIDDIYAVNTIALNNSDVLLAYIGQPSTGTGFEIAKFNPDKQIIFWSFKGEAISSQLVGFINEVGYNKSHLFIVNDKFDDEIYNFCNKIGFYLA